ncbi:putative subtilase-type protease inhibitor [Dissostichus eleginoides]|uniref:Subtilase-type protease inhibitor n=1 Tax=Dissostichus eleginoides TaxID=100907 RepID=A0AAD9F1W3_DISEL|nr:putative subtilase-type protease inhibitor [Dissostichus eleginoides]
MAPSPSPFPPGSRLRAPGGEVEVFSCSTRSLCVTSDPPAAVVPDGGQEGEASVSRRRNAFNKIFKKKTARH